jgi:hypothetical protein
VCTSSRAFQAGGGYLQSSPHEGLFPLRRGSSLCQQLVQFVGLEIDTPADGVSAAHCARLSVLQLLKVYRPSVAHLAGKLRHAALRSRSKSQLIASTFYSDAKGAVLAVFGRLISSRSQ